MKNNIILMVCVVIIASVLLVGCSKKTTQTTSTSAINGEDYFPGIDRTTLVEPIKTSSSGTSGTASSANQETISTNLKIGSTTRISSSRYGLSGIIHIISTTAATLENFTYNGECTGFNLYLTRSNKPTQIIVPLNLSNRSYNDESLTVNFPSNITINDIDSVAMTCSNAEDPIFVDQLE